MKFILPLILGLALTGCATTQSVVVKKPVVHHKAKVIKAKPAVPMAPPVVQPPVKQHWWQKLQKFHLNLP